MKPNVIKLLLAIFVILPLDLFCQENISTTGRSYFEILNEHEKQEEAETEKLIMEPDSEKTEEEDVFGRWAWFWSSRIDKNGGFSEYAKQLRANSLDVNASQRLLSLPSAHWMALGPTSTPLPKYTNSGQCQVRSIWANATELYVGLNGGGLWKRNGTSWVNLTDDYYSFSINDIEVNNSGTIYCATGWQGQGGSRKENDEYGMGIIYSTDGGSTWNYPMVNDPNIPDEDLFMQKILINPDNQNIMYALSKWTVYKSTNGGVSWTDMNAPPLSNNDWYVDMEFKVSDPNTIFICSAGRNRENTTGQEEIYGSIFKSTDGGVYWSGNHNYATDLTHNSAFNCPHWLDLATSADDPDAIYVIYETFETILSNEEEVVVRRSTLEKSYDDGNNWITLLGPRSLSTAKYMMHKLSISQHDCNYVFIGSVRQYRYDRNNLEHPLYYMGSELHDDLRDFYFVENNGTETIYEGNDAGIYSSTDNGNTWTDLTDGIQGSLFYGIATSETNPDIYLGGVGDCGTHFYDGSSWVHMNIGGDGGTCLINDQNTANIFAMQNHLYMYTKDGGTTWPVAGTRQLNKYCYNSPIILHPYLNKVYLSESEDGWIYKIKVSVNNGDTWNDYYTIPTGNDRIMAMAISKSNPDYFYLTKDLYEIKGNEWTQTVTIVRTTNDGSTWTDITSNLGSITTEAKMTAIEIHPEDPDKVWVCFGGLSAGKKIYTTTNGGGYWTNISYNLPNLPLADIAYDEISNTIYVANDVGVYYMKDGNTSWQRMGDLPHAIVTGLSLNQSSRKLYAATWGRGLWASDDLPEDECYDVTPLYISSVVSWNTDQNICQDVYVQNGGMLVISADITLSPGRTLNIEDGGMVTINGGLLYNGNTIIYSGGSLTLSNNGIIELGNGDNY